MTKNCHFWEFLEIGKNHGIFKKNEKGNITMLLSLKYAFANFHEKIKIFYEIRGYLVFFHFKGLRPEILRVLFEKEL